MIEHRCIAIYPEKEINEQSVARWKDYIALACRYGFNEVFSTMHLPELTLKQQVEGVITLADTVKAQGLEFTVDIGGPFITGILADEELLEKVAATGIDFIRLDYGYDHQQVRQLWQKLHIKGFAINASIYREEEMERELAFFSALEGAEVRTCHNFYPREETGINREFALNQDRFIKRHGLPVYYCIPSHTHPRGPVFKGLPTIEKHRYMNLTDVVLDLIYDYMADGIMLADEFACEQELSAIQTVVEGKPLTVRISCDDKYDSLLIKDHVFRYDSNFCAIRSKSSRQMAEFASRVEPENCQPRHPGDVTVDNERYERYSGEVQVVMEELPADKRVNVAGHVNPDDFNRLRYYREGLTYHFVKG